MGRTYDVIDDRMREFLLAQPVFFVATAPRAGGHVNLSPKGLDSFRVLGPRRVGYLDLTGSGAETLAHLRDDGRITLMFCSFGDRPRIVRLQGRGTATTSDGAGFAAATQHYPPHWGARAVIEVEVDRIADSCGYGVPRMDLVEVRPTLGDWTGRRSAEELADYRASNNALSIDGLPALGG
jgi:Pyridoxamine 5'-phosphate oxidase